MTSKFVSAVIPAMPPMTLLDCAPDQSHQYLLCTKYALIHLGWKVTCIGANNGMAQSLLKQEYKDDISVKEAVGLTVWVMSKTMDSTTLGSEKHELLVALVVFLVETDDMRSRICGSDAKQKHRQPNANIYKPTEMDTLLAVHGLGKKEEDTEMKAV